MFPAMRATSLTIFLLCFSICQARAQTCTQQLRVGLSDLGFSSFVDAQGMHGISVSVATELSKRTGCAVRFHWYPRNRLFMELKSGRVDLAMAAVRTSDRDGFAFYLPYAFAKYDLVLARRVTGSVMSLKDFIANSDGRLNITRGIQYGEAVDAGIEQLARAGRVEYVNDFGTVFQKIDAGRADGTLATPPIYGRHLAADGRRHRVKIVNIEESSLQTVGVYVSRTTVSRTTALKLAQGLKDMVAERFVVRTYRHYLDEATVRRLFKPGEQALVGELDTVTDAIMVDQ